MSFNTTFYRSFMRDWGLDFGATAGLLGQYSPVFWFNNMGQINSPTPSTTKTNTRTSTATAFDHEGVLVTGEAGETMLDGGRRAWNMALESSSPLNSPDDFTGATIAGAGASVDISFANGYSTMTINAGTEVVVRTNKGTYNDGQIGWKTNASLRMRGAGSSIGKDVELVLNSTGNSIGVTLTSEWQRLATVDPQGLSSGNITAFIYLKGGDGTLDIGDSIQVKNLQIESYTGHSNTAPSEFIDVVDHGYGVNGVKWYSDTNGNTVLNNIVTEAPGTAISPAPQVLMQPQRTNLLTYSRDLTNAAWIESGTSIAALDAVGMDGVANSACTLTDNDGAAYGRVTQSKVVAADTSTHTTRYFIKKDSDTTRFAGLVSGTLSSGSWVIVHLNTQTGAVTEAANSGSFVYATDVREVITGLGATWDVLIEGVNENKADWEAILIPADGTVAGTRSTAATGSIIVGNVELHANKTIDQIRGTSPIFTKPAAVTVDNDLIEIGDAANWAPLDEMVWISVLHTVSDYSTVSGDWIHGGARYRPSRFSVGNVTSLGGDPLTQSAATVIGTEPEEIIVALVRSVVLGKEVIGVLDTGTGIWNWDATPDTVASGYVLLQATLNISDTSLDVPLWVRGILGFDGLPPGADASLADVQAWVEANAEAEILKRQA